jgi:hypothetical protein
MMSPTFIGQIRPLLGPTLLALHLLASSQSPAVPENGYLYPISLSHYTSLSPLLSRD